MPNSPPNQPPEVTDSLATSKINSGQCKKRKSNPVSEDLNEGVQSLSGDKDKEKKKAKREYQKSWETTYPWLQPSENGMICQICSNKGKKNSFTIGCTDYKISACKQHSFTVDHVAAIEETRASANLIKSVQNQNVKAEVGIQKLIANAYYLAKKGRPLSDFSDLNTLLKFQGVEVGTHYQNDHACQEFVNAISETIKEETERRMKESPVLGITIDESTDVSSTQNCVVFIIVLESHRASSIFWRLLELSRGTAEVIFQAISEAFSSASVSMKKIVAMSTDGASVMTGCSNGVIQKLRSINPGLVGIHCIAHRLSLASSDSAKDFQILEEVDAVLNKLYAYLSRSALRQSELEFWQEEFDLPHLKVLSSCKTRWLSRGNAIKNLLKILPAVTQLLSEADSDILASVSKYSFLYFLFFFADILDDLNRLSKIFQKSHVSITTMWNCLRATKSILTTNYLNLENFIPGENLKSFLSQEVRCVGLINLSKDKPEQELQVLASSFAGVLLKNLEERFPTDIISDLLPLGFEGLTKENIADFGVKEIDHLTAVQLPGVDGVEVRKEWALAKHIIFNAGIPKNPWDLLLNAGNLENLAPLGRLFLVLPLSSVDCERGFSSQNAIKTKLRNAMSTNTLQDLMTISICGPPIEDLGKLDMDSVFAKWKAAKDRRFTAEKEK